MGNQNVASNRYSGQCVVMAGIAAASQVQSAGCVLALMAGFCYFLFDHALHSHIRVAATVCDKLGSKFVRWKIDP